jgi:hypothetical protein
MKRSFHGLGFALSTALVLAGCSVSTDGNGGNGSASDAGGSTSADQPGTSSAAPDATAPSGILPLHPANVPSDVALAASGDWIFNTETCGRTDVTIDTAKGTVSCQGQAKDAFTFKAITQADTSQGTLTAGLFITRHLVIESGMNVKVIGNRPLLIVALDSVIIQGALRASGTSSDGNGGGFAGDFEKAGAGPGGGRTTMALQGGGGGGHCGIGGAALAGGKAYGSAANTPLVGGSAGGGGYGGGFGGGAVQIAAGTSIEVSGPGVLDTSGTGGQFGGGGGGAGGAILLEAPTVSVFGVLAANGGGGGSGSGQANTFGANGGPSSEPALGGVSETPALGNGGNGAAGTNVDGQPGAQPDPTRNQGGDGGAAGWIRINSKSGSATVGATTIISPALSTPCATQGTPASH